MWNLSILLHQSWGHFPYVKKYLFFTTLVEKLRGNSYLGLKPKYVMSLFLLNFSFNLVILGFINKHILCIMMSSNVKDALKERVHEKSKLVLKYSKWSPDIHTVVNFSIFNFKFWTQMRSLITQSWARSTLIVVLDYQDRGPGVPLFNTAMGIALEL